MNPAASGVVVRVKLGERGAFDEKGQQVAERVRSLASLSEFSTKAEYLRMVVDGPGDPEALARSIEALDGGLEVVSMGRRLEIIKQVGSPQDLETTHGISRLKGTHGIGHTRLSTESRVSGPNAPSMGPGAVHWPGAPLVRTLWRLLTTGPPDPSSSVGIGPPSGRAFHVSGPTMPSGARPAPF